MDTPKLLDKTAHFSHAKTCPSCQQERYVWNEEARYIYCYNCGVTSDLTFNKTLNEKKELNDYEPWSFLRVGQKISLEDKEWMMTARYRYRSNYKEYYSDDEGSGYSNETWDYDVYILKNKKGEIRYLTEDKTGYTIGMPITVDKTDIDPTDMPLFINFFDGGSDNRVIEYGSTRIMFFEGEADTENPPAVETVTHFASYKDVSWSQLFDNKRNALKTFTVEQGDGWKEFSSEEKIKKQQLYAALKDNPYIATYQERENAVFSIRKTLTWAAVISFFIFIGSLFSDGSPTFNTTASVSDIDKETGYLSKPFEIDDLGTNYNLEWGIDFKSTLNQGMYVVVEVLNKDKAVINAVESDFWYESGYDSDGSWTESERSSSKYFKFTEKGKYYTRFYARVDSSYFTKGNTQAVVSVQVNKGALMSRYFLMVSVFLGIVALFLSFGATGRKFKNKYIYAGIK